MISDLRDHGTTEKEFDLAKKSSINSSAFLNDTPKKRIENQITEKNLGLQKGFFENFSKNLEKVTLNDVNQALKRFLKPETVSITVLGTSENLKEKLSTRIKIPLNQITITPYTSE